MQFTAQSVSCSSPVMPESCNTGHMTHHPSIDNDLRYAVRISEKLELFLLHDHYERMIQALEDVVGLLMLAGLR